ncbi:Nucleoporin interacting component Nup93/Nic96, partial [Trinorchestia longiramus]
VDVVEVTEMVARSCEKRGLHEDAVKLYDLAKNHEKVMSLLNKLLAQVVHLATPSSSSTATAGAGSDRERVLELACTIGLRYRAQGHTASQQSASTLHLLLDLATVFDLYHAQRYHDTIEALLEDGVASNGAPVWPLLYYCVRAGGVREAAAAASENSSPAVVEIVGFLQQCSRSEDSRVSPEGEKRLRVSYKRSCKSMRDPFKRALYCLLGRCDVMEDHSDIITTTDDYLWLKLSLVDPSTESEGAVPATPTLGGGGSSVTKQQDVLSLASLQKLLYKQYGETHFNAYEQPLLYTTVLLLTGQFEAAIEFLRRSDRYLHHAVHIAAALYTCGVLCLPRSIAAPLLSRESDEPECCMRLNISRLVLLYTRRFEASNPNEALHYCFLLSDTMTLLRLGLDSTTPALQCLTCTTLSDTMTLLRLGLDSTTPALTLQLTVSVLYRVIRRLHLIALDRSEVEARVSGLVGVASEVKEVIPALLLAAITATHHIYTSSSSSPSSSTPSVGDASSTQHLRQQARAIVTFAGMIPLRLHADINARLVQLEALIN